MAAASQRHRWVREILGYGVIVAGVFLAWQVAKAPLVRRAPPALALKISPTSPEALWRAAELELNAGQTTTARILANESLSRSPFNARALRVRGLVAARENQTDRADEILTLAGNWSLRDDPAHGWLVQNRLQRGDYTSAFAHGDTLVRRRDDLYPQVFELFTKAIMIDPRALRPLVQLLAARPPWRNDYLEYLLQKPDGAPALLVVGVALQHTKAPLTNDELLLIYRSWMEEQRIPAILYLRTHIGRPSTAGLLQDGDFTRPEATKLPPFDWQFGTDAGLYVEVVERIDQPQNLALRVDYDGYGRTPPVFQLLDLRPGTYRLAGSQQLEVGNNAALGWTVRCVGTDQKIAGEAAVATSVWKRFELEIRVPASGCEAQWLRLETDPQDRRQTTVVHYDQMSITPAGGSG